MSSTKTRVFSKLFRKKILNSAQLGGTKILANIFYLYYCHQFKALSLRNMVTKKTGLWLKEPDVAK